MILSKKRLFLMLILYILVTINIVAGCEIVFWKLNVDNNNSLKEQINKAIVIEKSEKNDDTDDNTDDDNYLIDFDSLKKINKDVVGYLKVNNTKIDYVVVQGTNNDYYLSHNFKKEDNVAGWIFADFRNNLDGTDRNIIIYGHNTRDGSMFGTIKNLTNYDWVANTPDQRIFFATEKGIEYYEIFSVYKTDPDDFYIKTSFLNDNDFEEFLKTLKSRSIRDYGVEVSSSDHIITLSTCSDNGTKRIAIHARRMG